MFFTSTVGAEHVTGFDHLRTMIAKHKSLSWEELYDQGDDGLIKFLIAMHRKSYDGIFDVAKMDTRALVLADRNIENVYDGLKNIIDHIIVIPKEHKKPSHSVRG